jgi:hypothetical protein
MQNLCISTKGPLAFFVFLSAHPHRSPELRSSHQDSTPFMKEAGRAGLSIMYISPAFQVKTSELPRNGRPKSPEIAHSLTNRKRCTIIQSPRIFSVGIHLLTIATNFLSDLPQMPRNKRPLDTFERVNLIVIGLRHFDVWLLCKRKDNPPGLHPGQRRAKTGLNCEVCRDRREHGTDRIMRCRCSPTASGCRTQVRKDRFA